MSFLTEPLTFKVSLTTKLIRQAEEFRCQQKASHKARQVYLNTLAVQAVQFYCECIGVETELAASDSWNTAMRTLMDVADLAVQEKGKLECRPVLQGEEICHLPPETLEDRIGYIVVEIDEENYEAKLLGFSKTASEGRLSIQQIPSLEGLIDVIVDDIAETEQTPWSVELVETNFVRLGQWFRDEFDEFWQAPELLLAASYRGAATTQEPESQLCKKRIKLLDIGNHKVALLVQITQATETELDILLKIYSADGNILPQGLLMQLLDDSESVIMETQAGSADNFRGLNFQIDTEELFSVRFIIENLKVTEKFIS
ncbi:MAG: DUF1822 family protein [Symploca sp. SIO1C2]|nr:DUF1822 family protein [Symploca sp. SIO1C2]